MMDPTSTDSKQDKGTSMAKRLKDKMNRISKIEHSQVIQQQQPQEEVSEASLIQFPWDDDQFSLCLENFPNAKWAKKYYNTPKTKSPLRKHWEDDDASDEEEESKHASSISDSDKVKEETSTKSTSTSSTSSAIQSDHSTNAEKDGPTEKNKKKKKPKLTLFFKKDINGSFPYNNDAHFLNRIEEEVAPTIKEVPQQRGRVEHVSPLLNNVALTDSFIYGSPTLPPVRKMSSSTSSIQSKQPSISSAPSQYKGSYRGGSINGHSAISETETIESWKMAKSSTTGLTSPIVLPTTITRRQQYSPTPSHEYQQFQYPPSRSGTVTPSTIASSGAMTPLQQPLFYSHSIHSGCSNYYSHPSPVSSQASSYRSIRVPKNADELVYYSNTPSLYSTDVGSEYTEKSRSYSQYFNPRYNNSSHKKKRSNSILSRLMRNIKQHFTKQQQSQEL